MTRYVTRAKNSLAWCAVDSRWVNMAFLAASTTSFSVG
jgi:hypothetical protein